MPFAREAQQPGMTFFYALRRLGVACSLIFSCKCGMSVGRKRKISPDGEIVFKAKLPTLQRQMPEPQPVIDKKTSANEIVREG